MNSKNENAAAAVGNHVLTACATVTASSDASPDTFARTPIVVTIDSFAENPDKEAATAFQLPNPSGLKIGAIAPPITANKLFAGSSTAPKEPFTNPYPLKNHITTQAKNKIVPALMINPFNLSHT